MDFALLAAAVPAGLRRLLLIAASLIVAACGFHLRGAYDMPFDTIYINLPETAELRLALKRNIEAATTTRVVNDAKAAKAMVSVLSDMPSKIVLSLSSAGQVTEYQLVRSFAFRVHDAANRDLLPLSQIVIRRDISYSNLQVLSKEAEEAQIWRDIQNDLVQQMIRRIAAARPTAASPDQN